MIQEELDAGRGDMTSICDARCNVAARAEMTPERTKLAVSPLRARFRRDLVLPHSSILPHWAGATREQAGSAAPAVSFSILGARVVRQVIEII
jgi:hypothetical protein